MRLGNICWLVSLKNTAWKVSKYENFSGQYFHVFRLNTGKYRTEKKKKSVFGHSSRSERVIKKLIGNTLISHNNNLQTFSFFLRGWGRATFSKKIKKRNGLYSVLLGGCIKIWFALKRGYDKIYFQRLLRYEQRKSKIKNAVQYTVKCFFICLYYRSETHFM